MPRSREDLVQHYQAVRDELRGLLIGYFEFYELVQGPSSPGIAMAAAKKNFDVHKQRLKEFWVLHDHLGDFIPGLVDVNVSLNERRQALRAAKLYLLLLLPETASHVETNSDPDPSGEDQDVG